MITHDPRHHNTPRAGTALIGGALMIMVALGAGSCAPDEASRAPDGAATAQAPAGPSCRLVTDTTAWNAFLDLADRIGAGEDIPKAELDAFGNLPAVALWRASLEPGAPPAERVGNWLEGTFWDDLDRTGKQKKSTDRREFVRSYRYSLDNRDRIDERLADLTGPRRCDMIELTDFWIAPGLLPDTLTTVFLPAKTEFRILDGTLLIDTGVVAAASEDQVIRQMASLFYRKYQLQPGPNPVDLEGEQAVGHSFRVIMGEGVIGWIEQSAHMEFDTSHPTLAKVKIIPEIFFNKTLQAIGMMNRQLGAMLDDEAVMTQNGQAFARHLGGMNAFSQTGYGMSAVIAARLGQERLREVRLSVPAFLAAYQEAALMNPLPLPLPGTAGSELYETVPALDPDVFTRLQAMLTRIFPD